MLPSCEPFTRYTEEVDHSVNAPVDVFEEHDLGTLSVKLRSNRPHEDIVVLSAPSRITRSIWLVGAVGCLVFLYSAALTLEWFTPLPDFSLRWPAPLEAPFWLLPLVLCAFSLALAVGGTRVTLFEDGLELSGFWPNRTRHLYAWSDLILVRFWSEKTRSRETLYGMRFRFKEANLTLFVGNKKVWEGLKERFQDVS